jgi:tetratricopeptide (TPR) repeat protein
MKCPKCHADNTDTARFCSNCAAPLSEAEDIQPSFTKTIETPIEELTTGSTFAERYQIIEELGRGGMGRVYKAVDCFEKATEADPNYALACARLSDSYGLLPFYIAILPKEAFSKAKAAVVRALEIDDTLPEAHSALGLIRTWYDWDWQAAESELKQAVQSKPSYVTAHQWYAEFLSTMGRHEEAIIKIEKALEFDPLSSFLNVMKGNLLYLTRQYDKAIEQCQEALVLDPNYILAHNILALSYLQKGMYEEALEECKKGVEFRGVNFVQARDMPMPWQVRGTSRCGNSRK